MKRCFKCGEEKPLDQFYKHPAMLDGHLNKCIDCAKIDANRYRKENIDRVREYDRNRPNAKQRTLQNKERLEEIKRNDPDKYRQIERDRLRNYREKHKDREKAHDAVCYAIITGRLVNPGICDNCGKSGYVEAHHEDYSKPLSVRWLCDECHKNRHREINAERRKNP